MLVLLVLLGGPTGLRPPPVPRFGAAADLLGVVGLEVVRLQRGVLHLAEEHDRLPRGVDAHVSGLHVSLLMAVI